MFSAQMVYPYRRGLSGLNGLGTTACPTGQHRNAEGTCVVDSTSIAAVKKMQTALKAVAAKYTTLDPGTVDGIVGRKTLASLASAATKIPHMPSAIKTYLNALIAIASIAQIAGGSVGATVQTAINTLAQTVTAHAAEITAAIVTALGAGPLVTQNYPVGTIYRWHLTKHKYRIYVPTSALSGLSFYSVDYLRGWGDWGDPVFTPLPAGSVTPPPPTGTQPVAETDAPPTSDNATPGPDEDYPIYHKWWFWAAVGGSVLVVGGGAYYLLKE